MMSVQLKHKSSKFLLRSVPVILVFLLSYFIFLVKVNSQSNENSNSLGYAFIIFSVVVIVLTILVTIKSPISDFLLKKYKIIIIALIILFLLIYFIPQISITGLFIVTPTTTTTTTTVIKEETMPGLVKTFSEMQPGINIMKVAGEGVDLTELNLDVYSSLKNVKIVISKLASKPISTIQDPPGSLYQYVKIDKTNIKNEDLKKVTIKFKVSKSWINANNIDESTISLNRYENNIWAKLSTVKTSQDNDFSYYETYTTGLSLFAITGISNQPQGATTTTTVTTTPIVNVTTTTLLETTTTVGMTTTLPLSIQFDRSLDCQKCGQHKAPPLTDVKITITATVSKLVQNTYLIDYYPVEWTVTNLNGGVISSCNSSFNKIQWIISNVDSSVSKWYVIKSPQKTSPPTIYVFFSEMESQQSNAWNVIVADPTKGLEQPYNCTDVNNNCAETTVTVTYSDGSKMMINYQKPVNYFNDSINQWQSVNSTLGTTSCIINYNYCVVKGVYEAHFKNDPTVAETVRYYYNTSRRGEHVYKSGFVVYQPFSLNYRNDLDQIQQINISKAVTGIPESNKFTYPNIFGNGYNVSYEYLTDGIKENLILLNKNILPTPPSYIIDGGNATLDLDFLIDYSGTVDIYIDGTLWDKKSTVTTSNRVDFKDSATGDVLFYLPKPVAQDLNETNVSQQLLKYQFKKTGAKLYTVIKTPYSWLNNSARVYPVTIDPSTKIEYNTSVDYYSINNTLNEYYFNATNAEQRIDDIQNYWSKNDVCLGLYFSSNWHEFCGDSLNWVWYNSTNFTTYMNLTGTTELKYAGYTVDARVEYYLGKDYPEVIGTLTLQNVGNKDISDSYLKVRSHDIRVNLTYDNNTFRVNTTSFWEAWSGWKEYLLDQSNLDLFYTENDLTTRKYAIFDNSTESWVEMSWNDSYWKNGIGNSMNYNLSVKKGSEVNAPVDLMFLTGSLNNNDIITTNFKWADAIKQNFTESNINFVTIRNRFRNYAQDAYENGTQYYIDDVNLTIELKENKIVHVLLKEIVNKENMIKYLGNEWNDLYFFTNSKFACFNLPKPRELDNITYCPENYTNLNIIFKSIAEKEIKSSEKNTYDGITYSIPYLLINNQTGTLTEYYNISFGLYGDKYNISSFVDLAYRIGRVNLPQIFNYLTDENYWEFEVNFSNVNNPKCVRFPLFRGSNLTVNVTMPTTIANYTFGRSEFIEENYTIGNSAIARIKPYPCCGITGIRLQTAEVCSS